MSEMERQLAELIELMREERGGSRRSGPAGPPNTARSSTFFDTSSLFTDLTRSVKDFDRALDQSNTSLHTFTKYNYAVEGLTKSLTTLTGNIPGLGSAITLLGKAVSGLAGAVFKQTDELLQASDQFAKIGAAGSLTTLDIMKMGEQAGLTTKDLGILTNATGKIGTGLIGLGANATDGIKAFAGMTAVTKEVRQEFQRMGVSQAELIDQQANYVALQAASGKSMLSQTKDADKLKKSSLEYSENLLRLSALTGKGADVLQEEQKQQAMELEELIAKRQEDDKIRELRKSGANAEADALEKEQKNRVAFIEDMALKYGKAAGVALGKVARTGSYDQTTAGYANLGIDAGKIQSDLKNGMDGTKLANEVGDQLKVGMSSLLKNLGQGAQFNAQELFTSMGFTDFKELLGKIGTRIGINDQAQSDAAKKVIEDNKLKTGVAATDPAQIARNFVKETEISLTLTKQGFVALANVLVQGTANFETNLKEAGEKLKEFAKSLVPESVSKAAEAPSNILPKVNKAEAVGVGAAATVAGKVGEAVAGRIPVVGTAFTILKKVGKLEVIASLIDMVGGDEIATWLKGDTKVEDIKKLPTTIATQTPIAVNAVKEELSPGTKQFENIKQGLQGVEKWLTMFSENTKKLLGEIADIPSASTAPVATPAASAGSPDTSATRSHGTTGETGKEVEPKDVVAQLHAGEKVLPKEEAEIYIKDKAPVPGVAAPVATTSPAYDQTKMSSLMKNLSAQEFQELASMGLTDFKELLGKVGASPVSAASPVAAPEPVAAKPAVAAPAAAPAAAAPAAAPAAAAPAAAPAVVVAGKPWGKSGDADQDIGPAAVEAKSSTNKTNVGNFTIEDYIPNDRKMNDADYNYIPAAAPTVTTGDFARADRVAAVSAPVAAEPARTTVSASETLSKVTLEAVNPVVVDALKKITTSSTPEAAALASNNSNSEKMMFEVLSLFTNKCDQMIDKLEAANDIAAKILRESR